jgi:hypothetical protein
LAEFESNINDVIIDIEKKVLKDFGFQGMQRVLNDVTAGILRTMKRRIHRDGMDGFEQQIGGGKYSTHPAYFNPKDGAVVIGKANKGKTGKTAFKNGDKHKTRYYSRGYKEWRSVNKKITNKVNLEFKGDLRRGLTFQKSRYNVFQIGFSNISSIDKANGLEKKYGQQIWTVGVRENKTIDEILKIYTK